MKNRVYLYIAVSLILVTTGYAFAVFNVCDPLVNKELYCNKIDNFQGFYSENIRGHIFAGFLALGGFLLSLKTFIVVNMKENLYDNPKYQDLWRRKNKIDPNLLLYAPLKELSDILFYAISASIFSAITQMTIGLYETWYAALFSIFTCIVATLLLLESLRLIKNNLDSWFEHIESR
ncbi:hypothetical protein [Shewanella sedimentimangrovi]|uniref:DUF2975 domain-containing protein n=1 Tax=Shewanella sedimentimangrovi TaxID=2814293 RepID=A0ABX7R3F4_9GAMM|nr:hypothetical protein [Shewanella sedimentimangrovi]QSX37620.1 hypothetical protein JYB85_01930 [Shewanella sedimentimangrovi]